MTESEIQELQIELLIFARSTGRESLASEARAFAFGQLGQPSLNLIGVLRQDVLRALHKWTEFATESKLLTKTGLFIWPTEEDFKLNVGRLFDSLPETLQFGLAREEYVESAVSERDEAVGLLRIEVSKK